MDYAKPPKTFAIMCDLFSRASSPFPMANDYIQRILFSAMNGSCRFFLDPWERPAGYVCWAEVNIETLCRLGRTGRLPAHHYEWDEGDITLLLDVTICPGHFRSGLAQLDTFMRERGSGAYAKRNTLTLYRYAGGGAGMDGATSRNGAKGGNRDKHPQRKKFLIGSQQSLKTFSHIARAERALAEFQRR